MLITGLLMILAASAYPVIVINDPSLSIHFWDADLKPKLNYSFYLVLITGVATWLLSLVLLVIDRIWPRTAALIFHHGVIADDSIFEVYIFANRLLYSYSSLCTYRVAIGKIDNCSH